MRTVFHLFGAYVGQLTGVTQVGWWPNDPMESAWDVTRLMPCDLAKTPSAARQGVIQPAQIQCDDYRSEGGLNGIGPRFPGGQMIGSMWLHDLWAQQIGSPAFATAGIFDYELTMTMYWEGELGDRTFNGFHARIVGEQGPLTLVEIWNGGTAQSGAAPAGRWWLDLAAVSDPNYTTISSANPTGALFLDRGTQGTIPLFIPKKPPGMGFDGRMEEPEH
ncbi:MAG: hypothetical protein AB7T06_02205 [Kofleriaceae bacterium]